MGQESAAVCHWEGRSSDGRAWLEGDHILFRGDFRLKLMLADIRAAVATNGRLSLTLAAGTAALDLGTKAQDWADRIRNPRTLVDKLGFRPGQRIELLGAAPDPVLLEELSRAGLAAAPAAAPSPGVDWAVLTAASPGELDAVPGIAAALAPAGGLWIVHPKGKGSPVPQERVFEAGRGAGLVDTKICAVSAASTALKFVRPKASR
ncbi:MAG TPA: hypothetical protein VED40_09205 [Azospirillaceae bacterium]|nr:hypothetical protein [Azospirillaceae bacterium]